MRALLSVYDKSGIAEFARGLRDLGYEIISTGGTATALRAAAIEVIPVADVTGFPEILDGRVKTLHPAIHGGLLAQRDDPSHVAQLTSHNIAPIDLVVSNLYPFEQTVAHVGVADETVVDQIDIGGPAMIRAAAKNYRHVVVLIDPADLTPTLDSLRSGGLSLEQRRQLAAKAFAHVSTYDSVISDYMRGDDARFPAEWSAGARKQIDLRYGENPRQRAAAYRRLGPGSRPVGVLDATQLAGKDLSYNNLLDADAAWTASSGFSEPTVAIVKHTIPCGLASRNELSDAFGAALAGDPVSAYGGIVALNRAVDDVTARQLSAVFFEVVIAPGFSEEATRLLARKKGSRLLQMPGDPATAPDADWEIRTISGGFLLQEPDTEDDDVGAWSVASRTPPSEAQLDDLRFAWNAVRYVKSNGVVLARHRAIVGVGSGQPNRVGSVEIALRVSGKRTEGAVLASDAYFPFADGVEAAIRAGVGAIVQPGGSIRDAEAIAAADAAGIPMVMTGRRHFLH